MCSYRTPRRAGELPFGHRRRRAADRSPTTRADRRPADEQRLHFYEVAGPPTDRRCPHGLVGRTGALRRTEGQSVAPVDQRDPPQCHGEGVHLRLRTHEWTRPTGSMTSATGSAMTGLAQRVGWAVTLSYEIVTGQPTQQRHAEPDATHDSGCDSSLRACSSANPQGR